MLSLPTLTTPSHALALSHCQETSMRFQYWRCIWTLLGLSLAYKNEYFIGRGIWSRLRRPFPPSLRSLRAFWLLCELLPQKVSHVMKKPVKYSNNFTGDRLSAWRFWNASPSNVNQVLVKKSSASSDKWCQVKPEEHSPTQANAIIFHVWCESYVKIWLNSSLEWTCFFTV